MNAVSNPGRHFLFVPVSIVELHHFRLIHATEVNEFIKPNTNQKS